MDGMGACCVQPGGAIECKLLKNESAKICSLSIYGVTGLSCSARPTPFPTTKHQNQLLHCDLTIRY